MTLIIAEAGVNHNGDIKLAKKLVDVAAESGADMVKFQTFTAKAITRKTAKKASYQMKSTLKNESQYEMLQKLELSHKYHRELMEYCNKVGIKFFSTAFDIKSVDLLLELGLNIFKIPSGEITNLPLLRHIGQLSAQVIMSTGMSTLEEIAAAIEILQETGTDKGKITILHCNTEYPSPMKDINLKAMVSLKKRFDVNVGYSDHTLGIEVPIAAVALGASVIEKHFTLDKNLQGPDHKASLDPVELKKMVSAIRNIEIALSGDGVKRPSSSEKKNIKIARKSLVALKKINAGDIFTISNLGVKRPGTGISPMLWDDYIGQAATKNYETDDLIE